MREPMTDAQKEEVAGRVRECVLAGGDVSALVEELCKKHPKQWEAIIAGADYTQKFYEFQRLKDAAAKELRVIRLGEDLAVVEELMEKLPGVLQRLRAAEVANGQDR